MINLIGNQTRIVTTKELLLKQGIERLVYDMVSQLPSPSMMSKEEEDYIKNTALSHFKSLQKTGELDLNLVAVVNVEHCTVEFLNGKDNA